MAIAVLSYEALEFFVIAGVFEHEALGLPARSCRVARDRFALSRSEHASAGGAAARTELGHVLPHALSMTQK